MNHKWVKLDLNVAINTFSKGMKRQVAIVCALATNAKYMLLDETFDGLDPVIKKFMKKKIIEKLENNKTTVILTSHSLRELEDICDYLAVIVGGKILFNNLVDNLKTSMIKVQISLKGDFDENNFKKVKIVDYKKSGSIATLLVDNKDKEAMKLLKELKPVLLDVIPLSLEEVFIYEMEAVGYDYNKIIF